MIFLTYGFFSILFLTIQSLSSSITVFLGGSFPNFALLLLIVAPLHRGPLVGLFLGVLSGVFIDVNSILPFGFHILLYSSVGFVLGKIRDAFSLDSFFGPILLTLLVFIAMNLLGIILNYVFSLSIITRIVSLRNVLELIYTCIFAPVVFLLIGYIDRFLRKRPGGQYL